MATSKEPGLRSVDEVVAPFNLDGTPADWPLPSFGLPTPDTTTETDATLTDHGGESTEDTITTESSTAQWSTPPRWIESVPSKDSCSRLTTLSRRSRLFPSPVRKLARKPIFRFLHLSKRSASSPLLHSFGKASHGSFDGPSDEPPHLAVPDVVERRPSLGEYERSLTAAGDDRRRPSTIDLGRLREVQEDDHQHTSLLRRKLSRAQPDEEDLTGPRGLMIQALEKHQQEKALFRSASKHSGDLNSRRDTVAVGMGSEPSGSYASPGPLELPKTEASAGKSPAPASWARFPSHARAERCGPASTNDGVLARDFAVDTSDPSSLQDQQQGSRSSRKTGLGKKRLTTFGGLVRYYSNIFSNDSSAANRRSSIATGGWLTNPDLEMLPPAMSHEPTSLHRDHHFKQTLHNLERDLEAQIESDVLRVGEFEHEIAKEVMKDVQFVEAEAAKLGEQVREEAEGVEEEAKKFLHITTPQQHHLHGKQKALFDNDSPFLAPVNAHAWQKRHSTFVSPLDDEEGRGPAYHDGTIEVKTHKSKAEVWSSSYRECLATLSDTHAIEQPSMPTTPLITPVGTLRGMPAPQLKPAKARSPEQQPKSLDSDVKVRRFPSVTVVDDCKGHDRSVSLISVRIREDGITRSSTHDLLELIQVREQQERERLLCVPSRAGDRSATR
ncbi:hypothetical protein LTR62_007295 [Meristemomyces frigidus]|uniref:Uncharacterized protein n=1 Tax=Meristemomyces frigidus TaxID=1508187 RepID=A0AAN7TNB4_9PEZI|nr:hypothetical protein LTR62_007295 [Meristemomyces frigidus]